MLVKNIKDTKELWVAHNTGKAIRLVVVFFSAGCFLIAIYFKSRACILYKVNTEITAFLTTG